MLAQILDNPQSVVNYDSATAFTDFSYYSKQRDPDGDVVLICDVISVRKGAIPVLLVQLLERWPIGQFKFKAYRDNKLRDISPRYIKLLTNKKLWAAHLQSKLEITGKNRMTR